MAARIPLLDPFLIPAAEQVKAEVESFGRSALRGL
jgi:hypothetical protein